MAGVDKDKQSTLGWVGEKTKNAFGFVAKNIWRLGRTDYLDSSGNSWFNLEKEKTNLYQLTLEKQYEAGKRLRKTEAIVAAMKVPGSLDCLKSIDAYCNARKETCTFEDILPADAPPLTFKDDHIQKINQAFKKLTDTIQNDTLKGANIGAFSFVNKLKDVEKTAKEELALQLKDDKETINKSPYDAKQKKEMIKALKENHEKALKDLEETFAAEIKKQASNSRYANSKMLLIERLSEQDAKVQEALKKSAQDATRVTLGEEPEEVDLSKAKLEDLDTFTTLSGRTITKLPNQDVWQMHIPWRANIFYHNGLQDNVLADLTLMALAVHATGKDNITITLEGENSKEIDLLCRKAYEAARRVGFEGGKDGKINFMVNGTARPLLDEYNKDTGKLSKKGVFANEAELETWEKEFKANMGKTREQFEKEDPDLYRSEEEVTLENTASTTNVKVALEANKAASAAASPPNASVATVTGANAPVATVTGADEDDPDNTATVSGGPGL